MRLLCISKGGFEEHEDSACTSICGVSAVTAVIVHVYISVTHEVCMLTWRTCAAA